MAENVVDVSVKDGTAVVADNGMTGPFVASVSDGVCVFSLLATNGKPIAMMTVIDKETGETIPVNVYTCTEAVTCNKGISMEVHLSTLHAHAEDKGAHLTAEQKALLETKEGAQKKADEAVAAASLLVEAAKIVAANDATEKANAARNAGYAYTNAEAKIRQAHEQNTGNPHKVTAAQVGLGNVPNKATNDQQPTYTEARLLEPLTSGERLAAAFGKLAKAVVDLIAHIGNKANPHSVTASQIGALPKTGGTMTGTMTVNGIVLTEGKDYGDTLPETGVKGQLFFLKK